jgi:hypothetical protein
MWLEDLRELAGIDRGVNVLIVLAVLVLGLVGALLWAAATS